MLRQSELQEIKDLMIRCGNINGRGEGIQLNFMYATFLKQLERLTTFVNLRVPMPNFYKLLISDIIRSKGVKYVKALFK
jgi:hypothetical protein